MGTVDRELDAKVAEQIMGWGWWRSSSSGRRCLFPPNDVPSWFTERADGTEELVTDWPSINLPAYSSDIAAAMEVVTHLQKKYQWRFSLLGHEKGYWHAELFGHPDPAKCDGTRWGDQYAPTPALAICAAALEAVEGQQECKEKPVQ